MRRKRMKSAELRRREQAGDRCPARHPNWHGVRCERSAGLAQMGGHRAHTAEGGNYEWDDARTAA